LTAANRQIPYQWSKQCDCSNREKQLVLDAFIKRLKPNSQHHRNASDSLQSFSAVIEDTHCHSPFPSSSQFYFDLWSFWDPRETMVWCFGCS